MAVEITTKSPIAFIRGGDIWRAVNFPSSKVNGAEMCRMRYASI